MTDSQKKNEELKRERCWDSQKRWETLQETIAWVDSQQPVPRNSPQGALAKQVQLLKLIANPN
jgi:hypothetical protein